MGVIDTSIILSNVRKPEDMDLMIHPRRQAVMVNLANPNFAVSKAKSLIAIQGETR